MPSLRDDFRLEGSASAEALEAQIDEGTISAQAALAGRQNIDTLNAIATESLPTSIRTLTALMVAQNVVARYGSGGDSEARKEDLIQRISFFRSLARNASLPGVVPDFSPVPAALPDPQPVSVEEVLSVNYSSYGLDVLDS